MKPHPAVHGFSFVELVLVISVLAMLSGVVVPRVSNHLQQSRDVERLQDVRRIRAAIEQFHMDRGRYPQADANPEYGNWDVSFDGGFVTELVETGYLDGTVADPVNDVTYHYRYYVYDQDAHGCEGEGGFYVLGVKNFENRDFEARNRGFFQCANRDWGDEFAYVTGGGASWRQ